MTLSEIRTKVLDWINNSSITDSTVNDAINFAIKTIEGLYDWTCMETWMYTDTADDRITMPSVKTVIWLAIKESDIFYPLTQYSNISTFFKNYPTDSVTGRPEAFCLLRATDEIIVRPYPDKTYTYNIYFYKYSAELNSDTDENYWTKNKWDLVLWGALINLAGYAEGLTPRVDVWKEQYEQNLQNTIISDINCRHQGSKLNIPDFSKDNPPI